MTPGREASLTAIILNSDEVREVIAEPRLVPRPVREYLAGLVARALVPGEGYDVKDPAPVARVLGPLYHVFTAAQQTDEWARIREMAGRDPAVALFCVRAALTALLEAFDGIARERSNRETTAAMASFELLLREAMTLWGRDAGQPVALARRITAFEACDGAEKLASDLAQAYCVPRLAGSLGQIRADADAVELLSLLCPGRLWDRGMAGLHKEHIGQIRKYAEIAYRNDELRRVVDLIGRRSAGEAPGRGPLAANSRSEMHSVITSGDLQYLLPSELVKLRDPILKYLFLARWAEGKLLTYQLSGKVRPVTGPELPAGPIVALVDTSGSMSGGPETLAKAVVLAVALKALKSGRAMRVILFSSTGQAYAIDIAGERMMAGEFLDFLRHRFGGGTDFDTALAAGIGALEDDRYRHADLLFITDGLARLEDDRLFERWISLRERLGARAFTVVVGSDNAGGLETISDRTFVLEAGDDPARTLKLSPR